MCADVDVDRAKETVRLIEDAGGTAVADRCDVSEEADVEAMIAAAVSTLRAARHPVQQRRHPDAAARARCFEEHTDEDFERLFAVNVGGVFLGCKHAVLQFKEQGDGGVILNTGSVAGLVAGAAPSTAPPRARCTSSPGPSPIEGAPFGIRVNAICPAGDAVHRLHGRRRPRRSDEDSWRRSRERVGATHPLGKPITAEDCAEAAVYLVSDAPTNITGVLLPVDGGYVAR